MESSAQLFGGGDHHEKDVTLDMMDYKYIDKCGDVKMLEKILRALRSGQDGYFPHLEKHCEEKVAKLNPKSRVLRKDKPICKTRDLPINEVNQLSSGMDEWIHDMKQHEAMTNGHAEKDLPPIRSSAKITNNSSSEAPKKKSEKIKGSDFRAWDKYDAESECKKVEDGDSKPVKPNQKKATISHEVDSSKMSETEKEICAGKEKDKGNEAFKSGDFEEALAYYSRSMSLRRTAASVNNRALAYLRLERWSDAENDCDEVLQLEPNNLKAKLRRATALKELKKYDKARNDIEFVLEKEPNNARAKKILEEVERSQVKNKPEKKGRKMQIMEVDEDEEEDQALPEAAEEEKQNRKSTPETLQPKSDEPVLQNGETPSKKASSSNHENKPISKEVSSTTEASAENASNDPAAAVPSVDEPKPEVHSPLPKNLEKLKAAAGDFFRSGQYASASEKYSLLISRLKSRIESDPASNYSHALATLYNNRAACHLKSGDDKSCIADCDVVLELKLLDLKALIRRASAYEHMEKYRQAYEDFRAAQSVDWSASQAQDGANRVAKHLRDVYGPNWRGKEKASAPAEPTRKTSMEPKTNSIHSKPLVTQKVNPQKPASPSTKEPKQSNVNEAKTSAKSSFAGKTSTSKAKGKSTDESLDEKRAKIRQDLYAKLKQEGNDLVKKGNYAGAVESYTKSIKLCPKEVPSYTNRALCFLKLNKYLCASHDCTNAIKLDPLNLKAYYRRSQANKSLHLYHEAENDLKKVLEIDPTNKPAALEMTELKKLLNQPSKRKVPIVDVSDDEDNAVKAAPKENKTKVQENRTKAQENKTKVDESKPVPSSEQASVKINGNRSRKNKQSNGKKSKKPQTPSKAENSSTQKANITSAPPKQPPSRTQDIHDDLPPMPKITSVESLSIPDNLTPYEFGNLWNSIQPKTNTPAYKCILDKISAEQVPSMVSNKTTDHMIVMFSQIARQYLESDPDRAYNLLLHLAQAQRFNMAAMFLSKSDKNTVGEAFAQLANVIQSGKVSYSFSDINQLRKTYNL